MPPSDDSEHVQSWRHARLLDIAVQLFPTRLAVGIPDDSAIQASLVLAAKFIAAADNFTATIVPPEKETRPAINAPTHMPSPQFPLHVPPHPLHPALIGVHFAGGNPGLQPPQQPVLPKPDEAPAIPTSETASVIPPTPPTPAAVPVAFAPTRSEG